jgi:glutathione synthase/RimK-type ligase-like ATP-grasp enzyme
MKFYILDERDVWHEHIAKAARKAGYEPQRIKCGDPITEPGRGFIRPHATPEVLRANQAYYRRTATWAVCWVQDLHQVLLYENKPLQDYKWGRLMPETFFTSSKPTAHQILQQHYSFPLVSKAAEGASSKNVRILHDIDELSDHIDQIWSKRGLRICYCDGGAGKASTYGYQKGYLYLQEFIPHDRTYRVNVIGNGRAVFERYNYKDKPVAQTGNVRPWMGVERPDVLEFADEVAERIGTKWAALDILERPEGGFVLLETSLAWPWKPTEFADVPIFRTGYKWGELWDCMFDPTNGIV